MTYRPYIFRTIYALTALLALFCQKTAVYAQEGIWAQYTATPSTGNVAQQSWYEHSRIGLHYRNQRLPSGESIQTAVLSGYYPLFNRSGQATRAVIGGAVWNENIAGFVQTNGASLSFSYHTYFDKHQVAVGLQGGFFQRGINLNNITTDSQIADGVFNLSADPNERFDNLSTSYPSFDAGLMWSYRHRSEQLHPSYFAGIGGRLLNNPNIALDPNQSVPLSTQLHLSAGALLWQRQQWGLYPNMRLLMIGQQLLLQPGLWGQLSNADQSLFRIGAWWWNNGAATVAVSYEQHNFFASISYDMALGNQNPIGGNIWELGLGLKLRRKAAPRPVNINTYVFLPRDTLAGAPKEAPVSYVRRDTVSYLLEDTLIIVEKKYLKEDTLPEIDTLLNNPRELIEIKPDSTLKIDTVFATVYVEIRSEELRFDSYQTTILPRAKAQLRLMQDWLEVNPQMLLQVIGYSDQEEHTATRGMLARVRAEEVVRELLTMGIPRDKIKLLPPSTFAPPGESAESLRRVEVILVSPGR